MKYFHYLFLSNYLNCVCVCVCVLFSSVACLRTKKKSRVAGGGGRQRMFTPGEGGQQVRAEARRRGVAG